MDKDSKKDVYSTDGPKNEFPGYPSYPANEDITRSKNNEGRVILGQENTPLPNNSQDEKVHNNGIVMGTEADVNADDLEILGLIDENRGTPDSINLQHAVLDNLDDDGEPLNEAIDTNDLDIPGSELDDIDERIGGEDEENNYYSLGGDNHGDLEEGKE